MYEKINKIKESLLQKERNQIKLEGVLESLTLSLKELGFDSLEEAEIALKEMKEKVEKKEKKLKKDLKEWEKKYGNLL
jgi:hypothetical protein